VAVSNAVLEQVAARVAARCERAMLEFEQHRRLPLRVRPLNADLPRAVRRRAVGAQIAAEIHEERRPIASGQQIVSPVNGILLADPAEIQFHSGRQQQVRRLPLELAESHQTQQRFDGSLFGNPVRPVKCPGTA
jgi:hypothetical protein